MSRHVDFQKMDNTSECACLEMGKLARGPNRKAPGFFTTGHKFPKLQFKKQTKLLLCQSVAIGMIVHKLLNSTIMTVF